MQIGEVIRIHRKEKHMTQEEMAGRLGITASAVNKWENGNSYPDITLLAPVARLLGISLDTLLSFREELTDGEIREIICELDAMLKKQPYEEAFQWARKKLEQYPDCEALIWQTALILDVQRAVKEVPDAEKYDAYLQSLYRRALESSEETIRYYAADALFGFHMRKQQYDQAEECLKYFSGQNPLRKIKQAQLHEAAGRRTEAYKACEELLFGSYQIISGALNMLYCLAFRDQDMKKAHMFAEKQGELAKCFEMGKYYEAFPGLELAAFEKDKEAALRIMREMLSGMEQIGSFSGHPFYEHLNFREMREEFRHEMKKNLLTLFQDEESFGFLKGERLWEELRSGSFPVQGS